MITLSGVRVLDFSHILAGPFCTRLLADFGADLVKVESRTRMDLMGALRADGLTGGRLDRPPAYLNTNRGKRSITINLKTASGRELAARLAARADVIVENFSANVMARLELDYARLRLVSPGLIYLSLSGYGHTGPRKDWTSMNMNLQAHTSLMMVTGEEGDPPIAISNSWNDYIAGLHGCFVILQALSERAQTGSGAVLDVSQFECSVATLGALLIAGSVNRRPLPARATDAVPRHRRECTGAQAGTSGARLSLKPKSSGGRWFVSSVTTASSIPTASPRRATVSVTARRSMG